MKKTGYLFVYESLRNQIDCHLLTPEPHLASEKDLSGEFGGSRMTVRKALARREKDGKIFRRSGIGTFVKAPEASPDAKARRLSLGVEADPEWGGIQRNFVGEVLHETLRPAPKTTAICCCSAKRSCSPGIRLTSCSVCFSIRRTCRALHSWPGASRPCC